MAAEEARESAMTWDWWRRKVGWLALALFAATPAAATTVIVPDDPAVVVQQADTVLVGVVRALQPLELPDGTVQTLVTVDVEEVKRGRASAQVQLREPGGVGPHGSFTVYGAPRYQVGQRVLVLAVRDQQGALHTHLLDFGRIPLETTLMGFGSLKAAPNDESARARDWKSRVADYALELPSSTPDLGTESKVLRGPNLGAPITAAGAATFRFMGGRWVDTADLVYDQAGDQAISPDTAEVNGMLDRAFGAWTSAANVHFQRAGSGPARGFTCDQGKMLVSFNDPRAEIEDPRGCSGVLAIGGFCADNPAPGETIGAIRAGALVFNNGWATQCPEFWTMPLVEEVATHEAGHGIGLAHSCENSQPCDAEGQSATMFWMAHFDGRRNNLQAYDVGAALALYGPVPGSEPTAAPSPAPTASSSPEPAASPTATPLATASPAPTSSPVGGGKGCGGGPGGMAATDDMNLLMAAVLGTVVLGVFRRGGGRPA